MTGIIDDKLYMKIELTVGEDTVPLTVASQIHIDSLVKALQPITSYSDATATLKERHNVAHALAEDLMQHLINKVFAVNDTFDNLVQ